MKYFRWTLLITPLLLPAAAWSHSEAHGSAQPKAMHSPEETAFGKAGDPKRVDRTVRVAMSDDMRFTPAALTVTRGETIRFVVRNDGKVMHEMVLGTAQALKEHAEMMRKFSAMEHDEPYMLHVAPGKTGEIVWQFTQSGTVQFGCLIPGHFEAGMIGKLEVKK